VISIIGSCVTRDALEAVQGLTIGPYLARTSLASIASEPAAWINELEIEYTTQAVPWHRRLVAADFEKTHDEQLAAMAGGYVVIDLIEERVHLVETAPGQYVTRTQILSAMSNFDSLVPKHLPIFSETGLAIWLSALPRFVAMLGRHVPPERTIVHRAMYAPVRYDADHANRYLHQMYDALGDALGDATVITPSAEVFRAAPDHKWGPAPFHFVDTYYIEIAQKIMTAAGISLPIKPGFTFGNSV
jgi:hypothetical protein